MYFSRITMLEHAERSPAFWQAVKDLYSLHKSIWNLFADHPDRRRDFLYRLEREKGRPLIYVVSARPPSAETGIWHVETKPYKPRIRSGMLLAFMLRANPVRTKRDEMNRQHRHDVVMDAKMRIKKEGKQHGSMACLVQREGEKWLLERAARHGFEIKEGYVRADGYRQHRLKKPRDGRVITFSTIEFAGLLSVNDCDKFLEALYKGIGPAKGFGCGMMMVRRC